MHKLLATFLLAGMLSVSGCERGAVDASDAIGGDETVMVRTSMPGALGTNESGSL